MQKIYRIFLSLIMFCSYTYVMQAQEKNVADEVIWVVGDEAILKSQVEEQIKQLRAYNERIEGDPYCVVPENMAISKLYLNQAKIDSVTVSESEIRSMVEKRLSELITLFGSREKLEEYQNMSLTQIREFLTEMARENQIIKTMQENLTADVKVTPAEVRRYFSKLPEDSIPTVPMQVEVQLITIEPKIAAEEEENLKSRLRDYTERINKGEVDFSTLAILYSEDGTTSKDGGELGYATKNSFTKPFADVAFGLTDPKKVSKIVETEYGYHIIQLIDRRGDRVNARHILLRPQVAEKERQEAFVRMDTLRSKIMSDSVTFEDVAMYYSQDKQSRNNLGLMINSRSFSGLSTKFEMQDLPQEIGVVVDNLKEGEISQPFSMKHPQNQRELVAMVKLKTRIPAHKATAKDDYEIMQEIVKNRKKSDLLAKWISDQQKKIYVHIKDGWHNCEFQYDGWVLQ